MPAKVAFASPPALFTRYAAGFVRNHDGTLLDCFGPRRTEVVASWPQISAQLMQAPARTSIHHVSQTAIKVDPRIPEGRYGRDYMIYETVQPEADHILGHVLHAPAKQTVEGDAFDRLLAATILSSLQLGTEVHQKSITEDTVADSIADLFDRTLRHEAKHDKWRARGREGFRAQVAKFTSSGRPVEFCLPAFPCKSSNKEKVLSEHPDRAEHLALKGLHAFLQDIEAIYSPGARLWIISDGHVFSDCIGVDDDVVDSYSASLQQMEQDIANSTNGQGRITFMSLPDMFSGTCGSLSRLCDERHLRKLIGTRVTDEAEACRKILMAGFRQDDSDLRTQLDAGDTSTTSLYRGFSRFMLEDLTMNKYTNHLSRSQLRKMASKVAYEMIERNQAYSNLVQTLFPHHVRLSIHAHDNAGPKYAIQMLGPDVKTTHVLPPDGKGVDSCDKLHVPTPWHNCVIDVDGYNHLFLVKASVARLAMESGVVTGRVVDSGNGLYMKMN